MARASRRERGGEDRQVGYAVVGLGHIAQTAVLPAFAHARNSRIAALVSGDAKKRRTLGHHYGVNSSRRGVELLPFQKGDRPTLSQEKHIPPASEPEPVDAEQPST